jgi:hypothetical protein
MWKWSVHWTLFLRRWEARAGLRPLATCGNLLLFHRISTAAHKKRKSSGFNDVQSKTDPQDDQ